MSAVDRRRARGDDRLALVVDALEQLVHRLDELRRCRRAAASSVTSSRSMPASASAREVGARGRSSTVAPSTFAWSAAASSVAIGIVLTVSGADEPVDVHRVGVRRVLHAGRRPQRPLDRRARLAQRGEALAVEDLLEAAVGGARVGEAGLARELGVAERLEALVDLGVDARDEERRDRLHVDALALGEAALEAADERLGDALVRGDREQQRDVDVEPLVDHLLDRGDALVGARDLDHQVGAVDAVPVLARLLDRASGCRRRGRGRPRTTRSRRSRPSRRRPGAGRRSPPGRRGSRAPGRSRASSCPRGRAARAARRSRGSRGSPCRRSSGSRSRRAASPPRRGGGARRSR